MNHGLPLHEQIKNIFNNRSFAHTYKTMRIDLGCAYKDVGKGRENDAMEGGGRVMPGRSHGRER